jgi:hypothetical protein
MTRKQRRRFEMVGLDMNSTYSGETFEGSGEYRFKLNDRIDVVKYLFTFLGFVISFLFIWNQRRKIKFLLGDDDQEWKELPSPLHPEYEKMKK